MTPVFLPLAVFGLATVSVLAQTAPAAAAATSSASASARHVNTLGMEFAPIPGVPVQFCLWETRVRDFRAFLSETDRPWTPPELEQAGLHPVTNVTWDDASAFCSWLTRKERQLGKIGPRQRYRLPTDAEWTLAAGSPGGEGKTPEQRLKNSVVWPWGHYWPPLANDGNYAPELKVDTFATTAPVGSFRANRHGLYDLGGNVWEWCEDWYNEAGVTRVLRGGSFNDSSPQDLAVAYRFSATMNLVSEDIGFRIIFDPGE